MDVYQKARELGIATEFQDAHGHQRIVSAAALEEVLDALPPRPALRYFRGPEQRNAHEADLSIHVTDADGMDWRVTAAGKSVLQGSVEGGRIHIRKQLPSDVYRLALLRAGQPVEDIPLVIAPEKAWQGSGFDRAFVATVQLYSLVSARNWGIGDFSDLRAVIDLFARVGCDGIGLNPLHALFLDRPEESSPYAPSSRLFLNPIYVDPAALAELPSAWIEQHRSEIEAAREGDKVDYSAVAKLKLSALRAAFEAFSANGAPDRKAAFARFQNESGFILRRYACFEVLRAKFNAAWWDWPEEWVHPSDESVARFAAGDAADDVTFIMFQQWCAASQLQQCMDHALTAGMRLGLYLDVAVGVQSGGFDAWQEQTAISRQLSVGAPPDILNTVGQDWGLAGYNASGLQAQNFAPFRAMLRASLKYAGAIRLDHVLGLNRLYLIPAGRSPREGVYVEMPLDALLAVIAQESVAAKCMVVGEDLGTVPEGFRDKLAGRGILSYKVMMFERDHTGAFIAGEHYGSNALVTFNTHDLASFSGWRSGHDLQVKLALGIDPGESGEDRARANAAMERRLRDDGIARDDLFGVLEFLARSPSRILAIAIEDLLGIQDQPNIPGTVDQHPNWRRRIAEPIERWDRAIDWDALQHALRSRA